MTTRPVLDTTGSGPVSLDGIKGLTKDQALTLVQGLAAVYGGEHVTPVQPRPGEWAVILHLYDVVDGTSSVMAFAGDAIRTY